MSPLVTIGIPCFNAERWICDAIQSALEQTWPAIEIIVVDDGSSDESRERVAAFGERVQLIRCDHRGGNYARNEALRHARGEWLQFLDADDYLEPEKIAKQFAEAHGSDADAIYSPYWFERVGDPHQRWQSDLDASRDLVTQWLTWELPQTGAVLWRKSALESIGGWKESQPCCQEHELYLRALKAGLHFQFTSSAHAVYRLWSEGTVCRKDPRLTIRTRTELLDECRSWLQKRGEWTAEHQRVAGQACLEMARSLARDHLEEAVAYYSERQHAGLLRLEGPAAPLAYRIAHRLLGFRGAEALAKRLRPSSR